MCGIAGIILKQNQRFSISETIVSMTDSIAHRGPDGEGFMLASGKSATPCYNNGRTTFQTSSLKYIPRQPLSALPDNSFLAFGHRRLSILDLSEAGRQPMCTADEKVWLVYNGEIYNYVELKKELTSLGHSFLTECDTEVILHAYREWGFDCVKKFNGMWAFCIYDTEKELCFASRDRLGVKPFYYINTEGFFSFASEQKAFVKSGLIKAEIDQKALHDYLVNGRVENETNNFFNGVQELFPGNNLVYSLKEKKASVHKYYSVNITDKNEALSENELILKIKERLQETIKIRLRSDVEVGTCLSGGIDSSVISALMHEILGKEIFCFTSVFRNEVSNEEKFADLLAKKIGAKHRKIEPDAESFFSEADDLIYSQDVPIWDTSTYAQHKVMQLAKENKIKVVLDGQGADELFAGYHHHFVAKWNNLFASGKSIEAIKDIRASRKSINKPFVFYAKEKIKQRSNRALNTNGKFYKSDFIDSFKVQNPAVYFNSVNEQLIYDIENARLKSFLKCEDRCGMWHSVESRTPFSDDVELIDLMFSFNGNKKIKDGVSKYLLREASKHVLPSQIYGRYDKKGFETPAQKWLSQLLPRMLTEVKDMNFDFVKGESLGKINPHNLNELKLLFKLFVLARWTKVFRS